MATSLALPNMAISGQFILLFAAALPNILQCTLSLRFFVVFDLYLGGFVSLALALYLGYALFYPEKF